MNIVNTNFLLSCIRYFKLELEAKGAISRLDLPPFLSGYLDRSSDTSMFSPHQQRTYTTAHLSGGGWYLDCTISYTHPSELEFRKSLDGKGVVVLDVDEFAGMTDKQRRRAIARRETGDRKKEARLEVLLNAKEKKDAERVAKLAEKEKEKEEKTRAKGKKKVDDGGQIPLSDTVDQGSGMQGASKGGVKRKSPFSQLTEDVITAGTQAITIEDDDFAKTEDLILNMSIDEVVEDSTTETPTEYNDIMDFLKKVMYFDC